MKRSKKIAVALAGSIFTGVLLLFLVDYQFDLNLTGSKAANTVATSARAPVGPRGGTVQTDGPLSIEAVFEEKGDTVQLEVFPLFKNKPLDLKDVTVFAEITRYDASRTVVQLVASEKKFVLPEPLAKPHVFDISLLVVTASREFGFKLARADGVIELTSGQLASSGITLAKAEPATITQSFVLPGEIKFDEDQTAHIVPRVAGIVEKVLVSVGQRVEKGQLLAIVASTDLADRRSELLTADRRLFAATKSYDREKTLWKEQISAEQDYLQAQTSMGEAQIAVNSARQKLQALNASSSTGALNRYELRAPFAGTIVEKHLTMGEAVAADANVLILSDLRSVWAEMAVPAQRLNDMRVGIDATVKAAAFESQATGKVAYVGALLGEQTRTAPARVVLANPGGVWRPGMFVNVSVSAGAQQAAVTVAADALQDIDGKPGVFVHTSKGFIAQPVELGRRDDKVIEVIKGVAPGQQYALANSFVLKAELEKGTAEGH